MSTNRTAAKQLESHAMISLYAFGKATDDFIRTAKEVPHEILELLKKDLTEINFVISLYERVKGKINENDSAYFEAASILDEYAELVGKRRELVISSLAAISRLAALSNLET